MICPGRCDRARRRCTSDCCQLSRCARQAGNYRADSRTPGRFPAEHCQQDVELAEVRLPDQPANHFNVVARLPRLETADLPVRRRTTPRTTLPAGPLRDRHVEHRHRHRQGQRISLPVRRDNSQPPTTNRCGAPASRFGNLLPTATRTAMAITARIRNQFTDNLSIEQGHAHHQVRRGHQHPARTMFADLPTPSDRTPTAVSLFRLWRSQQSGLHALQIHSAQATANEVFCDWIVDLYGLNAR